MKKSHEISKHDSNTDVNTVWRGPKGVHSFRCSNKLWEAFVSQIKANGDSVCHFMEAIIAGVLGVLKADVYKRNTITIENLHVRRVVSRHRRLAREVEEPQSNRWRADIGWYYDPDYPDDGGKLDYEQRAHAHIPATEKARHSI